MIWSLDIKNSMSFFNITLLKNNIKTTEIQNKFPEISSSQNNVLFIDVTLSPCPCLCSICTYSNSTASILYYTFLLNIIP